jgi:nicotinamidase-related amidase
MKILIVVDMQEDFVNGIFGSDAAKAIVPYVKQHTHSDEYDSIIFTRDWHFPFNERNYVELKELPIHCVGHTAGAELIEGLISPMTRNFMVEKYTFGAPGLEDVILDQILWTVDSQVEIHMMGLCTDICIISNALAVRMWFPAARIIVHEQGCAGTTPEKHLAALEVMKSNLIEVEYDV